MKLFIDTDVGGDFDDAHAIALALASPEVDLVGISTAGAGGSAEHRAKVAAAILAAAGRSDVPVSAGFDQPRKPSADLARLQAAHILNAYMPEMQGLPLSDLAAPDALVAAARHHGPDLHLLTLCAATNVAAAFELDSTAMKSVGRITMMAGAFAFPWREANVAIDPDAADIVLRAASRVRLVGYDIGSAATIPLDSVMTAPMATPALAVLYRAMTQRYRAAYHTDRMIMCDVTAMMAVLRPDLFEWSTSTVAVELLGHHTRGMTVATQDQFFNKVFDGTSAEIAISGPADMTVRLHRERVLGVPSAAA